MGRQTKITCDITGKLLDKSDTSYRVSFTKWNDDGSFSKAENCDISHEGFQTFLKSGYEPKWVQMKKNSSGKWEKIG